MIRFCDKEICCVTEDEMDWQQMLDYFLDWQHMKEKIYVLDKEGKFVGSIIYNSLFGISPEKAVEKECMIVNGNKNVWVVKDCIILDQDIWQNGRKYFQINHYGLLPVLNQEHQLVCFAWNDGEANRELRMLDELMELEEAVDFRDVYPEAGCVTVHGCNELSFYFTQYLKRINMPVNVTGDFWDMFGTWEKTEVPDYANFMIYAEGSTGIQEERGEMRISVSADFECIDQIYEENIIRGIIKDTDEGFKEILERMKERQVVIIGTAEESLNAYDLLMGYGVDICCFMSENPEDGGRKLFGKEVLKRKEVIESVKAPVFVEADSKYSAWGFGETDFYSYFGYKRNRDFFLLRDYVEIPKNGYLNILDYIIEKTERKLVLIGDYWLCQRLVQVLEMKNTKVHEKIGYYDLLKEYEDCEKGINYVSGDWIKRDDICLLLLSEYIGAYDDLINRHLYRKTVKRKYLEYALKNHIAAINIIDYPLESIVFMNNTKTLDQCISSDIKVKGIVLGSIEDHSGNEFFRGILDNHPQVMMLDYGYLNSNLFYLCIRLAMERGHNILQLFWKIYRKENHHCGNDVFDENKSKKFSEYMEKMLDKKEVFTPRELFIMIHIAYARIWRQDIQDVSDMIIYWEPHHVERKILESFAIWLKTADISGYIINIVRNAYIKRGSQLKSIVARGWTIDNGYGALFNALRYLDIEKKEYAGWKRLIIKFEELKCNPQTELRSICDELDIVWSDILMETTWHGQMQYSGNVTGFDLTPVYRTYEEYYSEFDRFRIALIAGLWQKQHGYPYVSSLSFSRRELRDMFMKEFRFEEMIEEMGEEERKIFKGRIQNIASWNLWKVRRDEIMENEILD